VLRSAVGLFLEQGYHKTTTLQIAESMGKAEMILFRAYPDKEAILYALVTHMFGSQFENTRRLLGGEADPVLVYGVETALQQHICELSEALRDLYVTAYTLPTTSEFIFKNTTKELQRIFAAYLPDATESDFYELEIASGGVTRAYMAKPCDMYFPIERKLTLYLNCCMKIYDVPAVKRQEVIAKVLAMDLKAIAQRLIGEVVKRAEEGFGPDTLNAAASGRDDPD